MKAALVNALLFQAGWLICVLGAAYQRPLAGSLVALGIIAWHLSRAVRPRREAWLIAIAGATGAVWDSLLVSLKLLEYASGTLVAGTAPYWIVVMWMLFATTLNVSLRWFKQHLILAVPVGAVAGPAAYYAGYSLGGVYLPDPFLALAALSAGWAVLLPIMLRTAVRLDGFPAPGLTAGHLSARVNHA